ncbi:hypothetical protein MXB_2542, partial [Myxobolus squamalis]
MIKVSNDEHVELLQIQTPILNNFVGVVKLYLLDKNFLIQTKCLKVSNTSTAEEILENFLSKIEPQKLAKNYSIYAVFSNCGISLLFKPEYKLLSK